MMSTFPAAAVGILLLLVLSRHHSRDPQLPIRFLVVRAILHRGIARCCTTILFACGSSTCLLLILCLYDQLP